jgi:hypothetical protein
MITPPLSISAMPRLTRAVPVVHLEDLRLRGPPRQVQDAGQRPVPRGPRRRGQVVVELAGHEHLMSGFLDPGEQLVGAFLAAQRGPEVRLAEGGLQGPGQVTLGQVPRTVPAARAVYRGGQQQAGGRVEQAGTGQLLGHGAAPQQGGVKRGAGHVHAGVQPVDAARPPGHVHADEQRARDDEDDVDDHGKTPPSSDTATRVRPRMTVS